MRNRVKVVSAALLTGLLLPSTYSIDLNPKSAYTESTSSSVHQEQVAFYAYSDVSQALGAVKNAKKEEALKSVNENLAKGYLKISPKKIENGTKNLPKNLDEVTSLAYPVDEVKKNAEL